VGIGIGLARANATSDFGESDGRHAETEKMSERLDPGSRDIEFNLEGHCEVVSPFAYSSTPSLTP
jgi:hypothetical protein